MVKEKERKEIGLTFSRRSVGSICSPSENSILGACISEGNVLCLCLLHRLRGK